MTIYILTYLFIALATAIATLDGYSVSDLIASAIVGLTWPLFITIRLISKIVR